MNDKINEIMNIMDTIEYGFPDKDGNNLKDTDYEKFDSKFDDFYYLQTEEELLKSKIGVCWDQVELERYLFNKNNIKTKTYWICTYEEDSCPSHTFLTYEFNDKYYWFEHSWGIYKGIHEYASIKELLVDVYNKFIDFNKDITKDNENTYIVEYLKPKSHITCSEFYEYINTQKSVDIKEPLYFYHLVDKRVDMSKGLLSLQYMYDNNMIDLFMKNAVKYKERITNYWNIDKYKGRVNLVPIDYINALNIFRGPYGSKYIYFFKFPPYKSLGPRMREVLRYKQIYRINLNSFDVMKNVEDIFYGYDMSESDNKVLDRKYYETVTREEYFKKYDDSLEMNFKTLNHIGISFKNGYCPKELLECVEIEEI